MESTSDVGKRKHHNVRLLSSSNVFVLGVEESLLLPPRVPSSLNKFGLELFRELNSGIFLLTNGSLVDKLGLVVLLSCRLTSSSLNLFLDLDSPRVHLVLDSPEVLVEFRYLIHFDFN